MGFVHLHLHSEYSLVDGIIRINQLAERAAIMNFPAIAITEQGNTFSAIKFYREVQKYGIKPIIGAELKLIAEDEKNYTDIVLLCQHIDAYRNLSKLITKSYTDGQFRGVPSIKWNWLKELSEGLIVLSCAEQGELGQKILFKEQDKIEKNLEKWCSTFGDRYYIELQRTGNHIQNKYIVGAINLAKENKIPVVASNNVRFLNESDYESHEARVCIYHGYTLSDPRRPRSYTSEQYLRSIDEMQKMFEDIPESLVNSLNIAKRCNVQFTLGEHFLPYFPLDNNETQDECLRKKARQSLMGVILKCEKNKRSTYIARLNIELNVITSMGFSGYFLIVADFISWAKKNGIPVGPGRGSGSGSLVAYVIGITELDPIKYDLLFERFLNPERVSLPDFDIDFCMDKRDEVIHYVSNTYGRDHVSQIITYGTMAAKAVIRDVGRVLGFPYSFVDQIAKLIPFDLNMTLSRALREEKILVERYKSEDDVKILIDLAQNLEGLVRNASRHAGGVVIAPSKLTDFMPLYCEQGSNITVTQFDMGDVESIGLVKFDFLGLRTLTIIDSALSNINKIRKKANKNPISILEIPLDDTGTYKLIQSTETTAIFQLESDGIKKIIKRLVPDKFDDLVALVALFRPGPLQSGMVDDFIERKQGNASVTYIHNKLKAVLKPTYGIILYQEQVMQIAQLLADYTLGAADLLRRAMGKKKPEEMAKQRKIFIEGATNRGVNRQQATRIFDLMEKFAAYGFNKSHSVAYALIAYRTAWLKAHYPAAFMAAVLSSDMDNTDKVFTLREELRKMKICLLPPSINQSYSNFTVINDKTICYGIGAIKGVGLAAIENIIKERERNGFFSDLFDLCKRIDLRKINRRVFDALIRSGCLDEFNVNRSTLSYNLGKAISLATQHDDNNSSGQDDMFGLEVSTINKDKNHDSLYELVADWDDRDRLIGEKETLGFYLKGHPITRYKEELANFVTFFLNDIRLGKIIIAGFIMNIRSRIGRSGRIAEIKLGDELGQAVVYIYADKYQKYRHLLLKDHLLIVKGEANSDDYIERGISIKATDIYTLDEVRSKCARLILNIDNVWIKNNGIKTLKQILTPFKKGKTRVFISYNNENAKVDLCLGDEWNLLLNDELLDKLYKLIGKNNIKIAYNKKLI